MPRLSATTAKTLHDLAFDAAQLSASTSGNEVDAYLAAIAKIDQFKKAAFLGVNTSRGELDREDMDATEINSNELIIGTTKLWAPHQDLLTLTRAALLATDKDEFTSEDIENLLLPADELARQEIANVICNFESRLRKMQQDVIQILERIDEIVADGLDLTPSEHDTVRARCEEFPLSVTVERPRFVWSADRKNQARRKYQPGERFK
jgi:hypothetical protein